MAKYTVTKRGGVVLPNGQVLEPGATFDTVAVGMSDEIVARYLAVKKIVGSIDHPGETGIPMVEMVDKMADAAPVDKLGKGKK
jgi:hypothetical protein